MTLDYRIEDLLGMRVVNIHRDTSSVGTIVEVGVEALPLITVRMDSNREHRFIPIQDLAFANTYPQEGSRLVYLDSNSKSVLPTVNYIVSTQGFSGKLMAKCTTTSEVDYVLGLCSLGALTSVTSPTGLDVSEYIPY